MAFVKTYELCMYLFKKRKWPNVRGDLSQRNDPAYGRCRRGKFPMPEHFNFGKIWIHKHFKFIKYTDQLAMKAKDATRIEFNHNKALLVQQQQES